MTRKQSIFRTTRPWLLQWAVLALFAGLIIGAATSCRPGVGPQLTAEMDEPHFRRGMQMKKSEKYNVALEAFLKVISKRGDDAPESHLEVGAIYLDHIKDPLKAMYHLRKYRELKPNGANRAAVDDQVERAEKEIIRRVMQKVGGPVQSQLNQLDYEDRIEALEAENATLVSELRNLRQQLAARSATTSPVTPLDAAPAASERSRQTISSVQPIQAAPVQALPSRQSPPQRAAPTPPPSQPTSSGRTHVVQRGDTLYQISTRYYGSGRRWQEIYELNRDRINSPQDVPVGVELRLP